MMRASTGHDLYSAPCTCSSALCAKSAAARRAEPGNIISDAIARVREQVGRDRVLLGLSGGVDSSAVPSVLLVV
jgi:asparagine synthetase B (glutamine-hydrolysing)